MKATTVTVLATLTATAVATIFATMAATIVALMFSVGSLLLQESFFAETHDRQSLAAAKSPDLSQSLSKPQESDTTEIHPHPFGNPNAPDTPIDEFGQLIPPDSLQDEGDGPLPVRPDSGEQSNHLLPGVTARNSKGQESLAGPGITLR